MAGLEDARLRPEERRPPISGAKGEARHASGRGATDAAPRERTADHVEAELVATEGRLAELEAELTAASAAAAVDRIAELADAYAPPPPPPDPPSHDAQE